MTSLVPHLPHNARRRPSRSSQTDDNDRLPRPSSPLPQPTTLSSRLATPSSPASHLGEKPGRFFGDPVVPVVVVGGGAESSPPRLVRSGSVRSCRVGGSLTEEDEDEEVEWGYPEGGRGWWVVLGCFLYAGCNMVSSSRDRRGRARGGEKRDGIEGGVELTPNTFLSFPRPRFRFSRTHEGLGSCLGCLSNGKIPSHIYLRV